MSRKPRERWQVPVAVGLAVALVFLSLLVFGPQVLELLRSRPRSPARRQEAARSATPRPGRADEPTFGDMEPLDRVVVPVRAAEGASIVAPGGLARLEIPPDALPGDRRVVMVRWLVDHPADPTGYALDLQPEGLTFRRPVRLEMALPPGLEPSQAEIVVYDPASRRWVPERDQAPSSDGTRLVARLSHFSLRRIRIHPGMNFPYDPDRGRATFYLETDAGNTFERLVEGRWKAVRRRTSAYRELMKMGRLGRHDLILSGRLRAITGPRPRPEVFEDERRTVAMPAGVPEARTGWVEIERLDAEGRPTGVRVIARVNDYGPGPAPRRAGVIVDMTRATMEALGFTWGKEFGLANGNPDIAWIRVPDGRGGITHHVPIRVRAFEPRTPRSWACRLR